MLPMNDSITAWVRDPLAWAADCRAQADMTLDPEAQAAFRQLATEFEDAASEIDGLVSGYEALLRRRLPRNLPV